MRALLPALLWLAAAQAQPSLSGRVTDPSGAAVPGAAVELRGPGGDRRARTGDTGRYAFPSLAAGRYRIRILAQGFAAAEKPNLRIDRPTVYDAQL